MMISDVFKKISLLNGSIGGPKFATNAICAPVRDIVGVDQPGNILLHPHMITKVLKRISDESFGDLDVHLKKSSIVFEIHPNDTIKYSSGKNLFEHFEKSKETIMKYTFALTQKDEYVRGRVFVPCEVIISPITDSFEIISKHLYFNTKGTILLAAGEMLVERDSITSRKMNVTMNLSSGTFFNTWTSPSMHDAYETKQKYGPEFVQFSNSTEERIEFISSLVREVVTSGNQNSFVFEEGLEPSPRFSQFRSNNMTAVFYIADRIDKEFSQDDLDGFSLVATNNDSSKKMFKSKYFKDMDKKKQDRFNESYEIAENILKILVRPRVYASPLTCRASLALLSLASIILQMTNEKDNGVYEYYLSLNNLKMKRVLKHVVSNSSSFDTIEKPRSITDLIDYDMEDIDKNMFFDYTNVIFNNVLEHGSPLLSELVVGKFMNKGNFGKVHEISSIVPVEGFDLPSIPLVVKIFPVYAFNFNKSFTDMDINLRHDSTVVKESSDALDMYSKTLSNRYMLLILMEKMFTPDFQNEPTKIIIDVLRDIVRMNDLGFVHGDIKPDNIMRKSNGKHVSVDGGSMLKKNDTYSSRGSPLYSSLEMEKPSRVSRFGPQKVITILDDFVSIGFSYMEMFAPDMFSEYLSEFTPGMEKRELKRRYLQMFSEFLKVSDMNHFNYKMGTLIEEYLNLELTLGPLQTNLGNINSFMAMVKDSVK